MTKTTLKQGVTIALVGCLLPLFTVMVQGEPLQEGFSSAQKVVKAKKKLPPVEFSRTVHIGNLATSVDSGKGEKIVLRVTVLQGAAKFVIANERGVLLDKADAWTVPGTYEYAYAPKSGSDQVLTLGFNLKPNEEKGLGKLNFTVEKQTSQGNIIGTVKDIDYESNGVVQAYRMVLGGQWFEGIRVLAEIERVK